MSNDLLAPQASEGLSNLKAAIAAQDELNRFISSQMKDGRDYGVIPGTKKKSLYQVGAEKLLNFRGFGCRHEPGPGTIIDWKGKFWNYEYKAVIYRLKDGVVVSELYGSANSQEDSFAFHWVTEKRIPRGLNIEELEWKEIDGDRGSFKLYRIDNPNPANIVNSLQKRGQKRAMIGATKLATRSSDNFTANEDDEPEEKEVNRGQGASSSAQTSGDSSVITDPQRKRLWAIAKGAGKDESALKDWVKENYPYTVDEEGACSLSKILKKDYEAICKWAEGK